MLLRFITKISPNALRNSAKITRRFASVAIKPELVNGFKSATITRRFASTAIKPELVNGFKVVKDIVIPKITLEVAASHIRKASESNILIRPNIEKMKSEMIDHIFLGAADGSKECEKILQLMDIVEGKDAPDIITGFVPWDDDIEDLFQTFLGNIKEPSEYRAGERDDFMQATVRGMLALTPLALITAGGRDSITTADNFAVVPYSKNQQGPLRAHTDFVGKKPRISQLALCCLQGGGSETFFISPELVCQALTEKQLEILSKPIYHRVRNRENIGPFSIFEATEFKLDMTVSFTNGRSSMQVNSNNLDEVREGNLALDALEKVLDKTPKFTFELRGENEKLGFILAENVPHGRLAAPEAAQVESITRIAASAGFSSSPRR